ncbi:MAG TPA: Sua5/YciO/YrdC/YwlC family protein [Saprospiraceae bacterium]|nr:Sua5/YciO/YrdC/YwlC family protein [Saprospiraceae bacterium]
MLFEAFPYGLHPKDLDLVVTELQRGKVGIVPTDSVYAFCCLSNQKSGFESICALKHIDPKDALMSIVCKDLSQASEYFIQWPTPVFRMLNKNLPGPFTFILQSGHRAPSFLKNKRKTLGLRIPQHPVIKSIMSGMDVPLIVSSVLNDDDIGEYFSNSDLLINRYEKQVGFIIIEEGVMQEASTVVDLTGDEPVIIRQSTHELKQ